MPVAEYLEKYLVAPSPSRDYYGIKVIRDQVILYTWKVSHGPHYTSPIVKLSQFNDFGQDRIMHNEIQWVFGEPMLQHVRTIASNKPTLVTLPKYLVKIIIGYLNFKDVLKLSTISRMANEIFNGDTVWELLYKRHKMGLLYKDEKEKGSSLGWKQLFKERQMHRPAKERKLSKLSTNRHLVVPRSSRTIKQETTSFTTLRNPKDIASTTKLILAENKNPKSSGLKSCRNTTGRPNTANKKKSDAEANRCELFITKNVAGDGTAPYVKSIESIATTFGSKIVTDKKTAESRNLGTIESRGKVVRKLENHHDQINSNDKTSLNSKNTDRKIQGSLKSNPASARRIKCKSASNSELLNQKLDHKTVPSTMSTRKRNDPKSVERSVKKTTEKSVGEKSLPVSIHSDIGIDELPRKSIITEKYQSSKIFDRYRRESSVGEVVKKPATKISRPYSIDDKIVSSIYEKFSTPRKPVTVFKKKEVIAEKKFADIKAYLKSNKKNSSRSEKKPVDDKTVDPTKCKSRISPKTESSKSLDSKSTHRSTLLKKRGI